MQPDHERIDKQYTTRILARAEVFRKALMSDGPLGGERAVGESAIREACPGCGSTMRLAQYHTDLPHVPRDVDGYCQHKWHQG